MGITARANTRGWNFSQVSEDGAHLCDHRPCGKGLELFLWIMPAHQQGGSLQSEVKNGSHQDPRTELWLIRTRSSVLSPLNPLSEVKYFCCIQPECPNSLPSYARTCCHEPRSTVQDYPRQPSASPGNKQKPPADWTGQQQPGKFLSLDKRESKAGKPLLSPSAVPVPAVGELGPAAGRLRRHVSG